MLFSLMAKMLCLYQFAIFLWVNNINIKYIINIDYVVL